jgi:hypothetical protein
MEDIDLNVENYTFDELKTLLNVGKHYNSEILIASKNDVLNKITDKDCNATFKLEFASFLSSVVDVLLSKNKTHDDFSSHPVVCKKDEAFIYTNASMAFKGTINPLERRIVTKSISIDSVFRTGYFINDKKEYIQQNKNDFTVQLATPIHNVISMKLVALEMPRMWYSISGKLENNSFKINVCNMNLNGVEIYPNQSHIIKIPDGNYTNEELVITLNNYFKNIANGLEFITFEISVINGRSSFYVVTLNMVDPLDPYYSPDFYYVLDFSCGGFGKYIGFNKQKYTINKTNMMVDIYNNFPSKTYYCIAISESSCGVSMDNYIFVEVNDFNTNYESNAVILQSSASYIGNNILGRITLNSLPDGLITNNPSDIIFKTREYYGPVRIRRLQIRMINKFGNLIDLNDDYSLALEFSILYQ